MVLDRLRDGVDPLLTAIAERISFISPNSITWLSLIFAIVAGMFFLFSSPSTESRDYFLYFASLFIFLNGFTDAIDGKIAKISKKASPKGDFLDHAIDRFSDVSILIGLSLSGWCRPQIGIFAISGVLLTSYMGTQAQAVGYRRIYRGFLGRADRLVLLMIFPVIQHIFLNFNLFGFNILEMVLIYFAVVGFVTSIQRFYITIKWFKRGK